MNADTNDFPFDIKCRTQQPANCPVTDLAAKVTSIEGGPELLQLVLASKFVQEHKN